MKIFFSIKRINLKSQPNELDMSFILFYINNRTSIQNQEGKKEINFRQFPFM